MQDSLIKSVIFDLDNTLYDFSYSNEFALNALREYTKKNFGWTAEEFDEKHLASQHEIYSQLGYNGSCRDRMLRYQKMLERSSLSFFPHAVNMYELYWNTLIHSVSPHEGAEEVMKALKNIGIKIGIGSDMIPYIQMLKLERMELLRYVDFMVTSEEAGEEKPSEKFFQMCLNKAGFEKTECLFLGDDFRKDYEGAKNFGMRALWFNKNDKPGEVKEQIKTLREVLDFLSSSSWKN